MTQTLLTYSEKLATFHHNGNEYVADKDVAYADDGVV